MFDKLKGRTHQDQDNTTYDNNNGNLPANSAASQNLDPYQETSGGANTGTGRHHHQHGPNHPAATGAAAGAGVGAAEHLRERHEGERTGGRHDGFAGSHPTAEGAVAGAGLGAGAGAVERHHERRESRDAQGYNNTAGNQGTYDSYNTAGTGAGPPPYGSAANGAPGQNVGAMGHTGAGHTGMGAAGAVGGGALGLGAGEAMTHHHGRGGAGNTAPGAGQYGQYDTTAPGYDGQAGNLTTDPDSTYAGAPQHGRHAGVAGTGAGLAGAGAGAGAGMGAAGTHAGMPVGASAGAPGATGYGAGAGTGTGTGGGSGTGQKILGRLEQAIGTAVGSESMKIRGLEKEREGFAKQDIQEAQRLETLAANHRNRASGRGPAGTGGIGGY